MKPLRVFVMQPFKAEHSKKFFEMIHDVCKSTRGEYEAIRADRSSSAFARLQDRIDSQINQADICVADLIGSRNSNVLLEVGAAYALRVPVIPVSHNEPLPADISNQYWIDLDPNAMDKTRTCETFKSDLRQRLQEISVKGFLESRDSRFVVHGFAKREFVDFWSLVNRCQERIYVLTTNLDFMVNRRLTCDLDGRERTLLQMIAEVLNAKPSTFSVRILTLDPDSSFTNERASALGRNRQEFREKVRKVLNRVKEFVESKDCTANAQLKVYDVYPLQMVHFFDKVVVSSVVAYGRIARDCVSYLHSLDAFGASETYERHFEKIWENARLYAQSARPSSEPADWRASSSAAGRRAASPPGAITETNPKQRSRSSQNLRRSLVRRKRSS